MGHEDASSKDNSELILERDPETMEPLVTLTDSLVDVLKPHQVSKGTRLVNLGNLQNKRSYEEGLLRPEAAIVPCGQRPQDS